MAYGMANDLFAHPIRFPPKQKTESAGLLRQRLDGSDPRYIEPGFVRKRAALHAGYE